MLRKFVLPALGLMILPAFASAQFEAGNWELSLNGGGSANKTITADVNSAQFEAGYFATKELEIGGRQAIGHASSPGVTDKEYVVTQRDNLVLLSAQHRDSEGWFGDTLGFFDYHLDLGRFQPFVGAFVGYHYTNLNTYDDLPDGTSRKVNESSWIAGPEVGLKYFVNGTTFLFARVDYQYWFSNPPSSSFNTNLGVGFRF